MFRFIHTYIYFTFQTLIDCRKNVCDNLKLNPYQVELSMGMSNDFEHAVSKYFVNFYDKKKFNLLLSFLLYEFRFKIMHVICF